jgi:site-specific DNA recombinase
MNNQSHTGKEVFGNAPFGYRWHGGSLAPDENEAPIRVLMYELFLRHRRKKTVARLLNEQGYRTRNGALFSDSSVERILRDDSAKGIFQINQNGKTKEIQIEQIVLVKLWEQVNAILDSERKPLKKRSICLPD